MRDRQDARRQVRGPMVNTAKLDWDKVDAIRASGDSRRTLAERYGVTYMTVSYIKRGFTWKTR